MARKKDFRGGLNSLINDSIDDINQVTGNKQDEKKETDKINIEDISDEKVKWLFIKMSRLEKELELWRTGKLSVKTFRQTLKEKGLRYNSKTNDFELCSNTNI